MASKTLQRLMEEAPRGQPLDTAMLEDMDVSPALTTYMVRAGWLQRLSKGAYLLRGDRPSRDGIIAYLSRRVPGLHVAGKTALDWQGVRHNIAFRQKVVLWAQKPYEIPSWVNDHLSYSFQTTQIFDDELPHDTGLKPLPNGNPSVLVSVPERALLELASDIGKGQSMEEAINLMDSLRNIRPPVLEQFLTHCKRVKVLRLVRDLGKSSSYPWGADLQRYVDRLGAGKRWSNVNKDGKRLTLPPR
ncbi:type IV toxin-antitoxin system AbiEi family antitoxin domain-containing protein [Burkholderia cenocepacia]|uniref:type IV toxin-antitoxin system AbiEi family antitoxin domain-containing protein n=1 Tax=Burkholderia cenocepacia TaxID=95486 RepID=UPI0009E0FD23|nr:type IV toxin-antitoxin system AbiEi family antitoxin domain-containing protein [Burkholderia cenocepacia]ARF89613.1 type IV TA system AbiEi antitoxin transcriptional regulator [Burkholderia cenocepacia]MCW3678293.1 type IV toxin-antitoxin system AbiEi family antitoxin [Burkholderia cenocepacia]MDC6085820.1 type IV toxin-antitoxin system AbiEi family antitoxin domain-containing protein [Burkholderia cenocepacia]